MSLTNYHCSIQIPPVLRKFRTGSYLIYDDEPPGATNLRRGTALTDMPFRASGSHQLNVTQLETVLQSVAPPGAQLHLVDLREETHLFLNGHAVSWYADKDFANVGQTLAWIVADEAAQLARIKAVPATQIYCLNEDGQGNVTPTGYKELTMKSAATEAEVAGQFPFRPNYIRIPVTDHCMPSEDALNRFVRLCVSLNAGDWVHCHCHGGDGRTTTFLALFDMVHWAKSKGTSGFPTVKEFASRQRQIFSYNLEPQTGDWKYYLSLERWWFLDLVRTWIVNGGLSAGQPFSLPDDWDQRIASAS